MGKEGAKYERISKLQEFKMTKVSKSNIFNIPANYHFFESFFDWLVKNFPDAISDVKIFLPNQRSCRELRELFLTKNCQNSALILPKIKAISDLSFEDFFDFLPQEDIQEIIDELLQIKLISGIDHLFFLTNEIQKLALFGENIDAAQALSISVHLKSLFDEIEREEIDLNKFAEIDDSDLSKHRQVTLDFLKNFHIHLKNSLIKNDVFFASSYQNFIVKKFSEALTKYGSKFPLIIAGSTGSVLASRSLIKAIAEQKNGYAILHGLDESEQIFIEENHPQFFLNSLINFLEIEKKQIVKIAEPNFCLSSQAMQNLLSAVMLPANQTQKWQSLSAIEAINLSSITTKDELEEARIISLILAEKFSDNKKSAIITNNQKLAKLLKYELKSLSLPFNDSRDVGIFNSKLVNFILLILDLIENDFTSASLLAVLQNPLCSIPNKSKILENFENEILRQDRSQAGLSGIFDKLESLEKPELKTFFNNFCQNLAPVIKQKDRVDISTYSIDLTDVIVNLSGKKFTEILAEEEAQEALFEFFEKLKQNHNFVIDSKNALGIFEILFSQISFFGKSDAMAPIQILSTIEARLLNYDLVIVASLNEGDFPAIESENWLGKKIKKDLGIDKKLKKIGQNAYDFCNYLSNSEVILTRSLSINGAPSSPSPFLLKLETLCKKLEINFSSQEKYFELLEKLNSAESFKIGRPEPKPETEFRPKKLAITDISKLISDPYSIYAKRILRLKELQKIDFEPSYAEFGSFVHKALEEFVKNPQNFEKSLENSHKIFEKYFLSNESKLIWWPKFENIFRGFFARESEFKTLKNLTEYEVKALFDGILINGKIDRIAFDETNSVNIFDYKTGQTPSKIDVISGNEPQLTIAVLMLLENGFESEISSLNYWKLSFSSDDEIKKISEDSEEIKILAHTAKSGLAKLFRHFSEKDNGYIVAPNLQNYYENEYSHLARIKEWQ